MQKWFLITAGTMIGGILLVGLPGAVVFALSWPFQLMLFGRDFWSRLHSDKAWPLALQVTLLWPLALWPAHWAVYTHLAHLTRWGKIGAYVGLLYLWGVIVSLVCYKLADGWYLDWSGRSLRK